LTGEQGGKEDEMSFYRWLLQRLTGIFLVLFLILHIITLHFSGHSSFDYQAVQGRFQDPFWFIFYFLFLPNTLFHGLNGLYGIIEDYKPSKGLKIILAIGLWGSGIVALIWGILVMLSWRIMVIT
jgi:succinate dehydrogenase hydrophobic membrane anchor protein